MSVGTPATCQWAHPPRVSGPFPPCATHGDLIQLYLLTTYSITGTRRNPDALTVGDSDEEDIDPRACDRRPVRRRCVHMAEFYDEVRHNNTWPQQQHPCTRALRHRVACHALNHHRRRRHHHRHHRRHHHRRRHHNSHHNNSRHNNSRHNNRTTGRIGSTPIKRRRSSTSRRATTASKNSRAFYYLCISSGEGLRLMFGGCGGLLL